MIAKPVIISTSALAVPVYDDGKDTSLAVVESTSALAMPVREVNSPTSLRVNGLATTPDRLPGLAAWYDASDSATVLTSIGPDVPATDGQTVRRWLDKSGNGKHADQTVLLNQPTLSGGKITFGASKGFLHSVELLGAFSVFTVAKKTTAGGGWNLIYYAKQPALFASDGSEQYGMYPSAYSGKNLLTEKCIAVISPVGTSVTFLDGAETITTTRGARFTSGGSAVGSSADLSQSLLGNISELIVCSGAVSLADGQKIIKYLSRKWGVSI